MHNPSRRVLLSTVPVLFTSALVACAPGTPGAVSLENTKLWITTVSNALSAAASAYTGPQMEEVQTIVRQLAQAATEFAALGDVSTARSAALSIAAMIGKLAPMLTEQLGAAAMYVPIAVAVISAFVAALPPPVGAPAVPPPELVQAAEKGKQK